MSETTNNDTQAVSLEFTSKERNELLFVLSPQLPALALTARRIAEGGEVAPLWLAEDLALLGGLIEKLCHPDGYPVEIELSSEELGLLRRKLHMAQRITSDHLHEVQDPWVKRWYHRLRRREWALIAKLTGGQP